MSKTDYETKGISMLPKDWAVVDAMAEKNGNGRSSALRLIVRSYPLAERLLALGQAYLLDVVTAGEALERLADLATDLPLPISLTGKSEEIIE